MPSLGPMEVIVIFLVALVVFGPDKLPQLARQMAKGVRELRRVQSHLRSELDEALGPDLLGLHDDEPESVEAGGAAELPTPPPDALPPGVTAPDPAARDGDPLPAGPYQDTAGSLGPLPAGPYRGRATEPPAGEDS